MTGPRRTSRPKQPVVRDEHGTVHRPVPPWPVRLRPDGGDVERNGYGPADPADAQQWDRYPTGETVDEWRARRTAAEYDLLREATHGLELSAHEDRHLHNMAKISDRSEVIVFASLLDRAFRLGLARGRGDA